MGQCRRQFSNINRFVTAYNDCGLMEVSMLGPRFTWIRKVGGIAQLRRKLDRALWNMEAQLLFPEGRAFVLPRNHSDHQPIRFVSNAGVTPRKEKRPFRFEATWLTRED